MIPLYRLLNGQMRLYLQHPGLTKRTLWDMKRNTGMTQPETSLLTLVRLDWEAQGASPLSSPSEKLVFWTQQQEGPSSGNRTQFEDKQSQVQSSGHSFPLANCVALGKRCPLLWSSQPSSEKQDRWHFVIIMCVSWLFQTLSLVSETLGEFCDLGMTPRTSCWLDDCL